MIKTHRIRRHTSALKSLRNNVQTGDYRLSRRRQQFGRRQTFLYTTKLVSQPATRANERITTMKQS